MSKVADLESNPQEDEDQGLVPQAPGTGASIPTTSSLATPGAQTTRKSSSGYTNLKKYLTANKDNNLINTVTHEAQSKLTGAQNQLQGAQQQFQTGIQGEKAKLQGAVGESQKAQQYVATGAQPLIQETAPVAVARPEAIRERWTSDTDDQYNKMVSDYDTAQKAYQDNLAAQQAYQQRANQVAADKLNQLKNYTYQGPQGLENVQGLAGQQAGLEDFARATGSESGRGAILQNLFGRRGNYSAGARNLDTVLLGAQPSNLEKLKALRAETSSFGQNLKGAQQQVGAEVGAARGLSNIQKADQAKQLASLRDSLYQQLQSQADAANIQGRANAGELTNEELRKFLQDKAAYELVSKPQGNANFGNQNAVIGGTPTGSLMGSTPALGSTPGQINLPVEGQQMSGGTQELPKDYINLYKNFNFDPRQDVLNNPNLNQDLSRHITNDKEHYSLGNPNAEQAFVDIATLKPLFNQTYQDNTASTINRELLNRRNVLSDVLGDNAQNGLLTAGDRNEVQTTMNDQLLTSLKETPTMARDQYAKEILGGAPGEAGLRAISNWKELGYDNPIKMMQELQIHPNNVSPWSLGWNPELQTVILPNGHQMPFESYRTSIQRAGWNNSASPAAVAKKLQQKYLIDRLKELGFEGYTTAQGQDLGQAYVPPTLTPEQQARADAAGAAARAEEQRMLNEMMNQLINQNNNLTGSMLN